LICEDKGFFSSTAFFCDMMNDRVRKSRHARAFRCARAIAPSPAGSLIRRVSMIVVEVLRPPATRAVYLPEGAIEASLPSASHEQIQKTRQTVGSGAVVNDRILQVQPTQQTIVGVSLPKPPTRASAACGGPSANRATQKSLPISVCQQRFLRLWALSAV